VLQIKSLGSSEIICVPVLTNFSIKFFLSKNHLIFHRFTKSVVELRHFYAAPAPWCKKSVKNKIVRNVNTNLYTPQWFNRFNFLKLSFQRFKNSVAETHRIMRLWLRVKICMRLRRLRLWRLSHWTASLNV
jgi:hypothetical protein